MKKQSIGALTGIRFLAALGVVVFHLAPKTIATFPAGFSDFFNAAYIGVNLFFVLSGFILVYNYVGENGELKVSRADFYIARISRIVPVYVFCMLIAMPVLFSDMLVQGFGIVSAALNVLGAFSISGMFMQAWIPYPAYYLNVPSWSLSNEAFFYLCFPAVIFLLRRRSIGSLTVIALAAWLIAMTGPVLFTLMNPAGATDITPYSEGLSITALKYNPLLRLPEFVIGAVTGSIFVRVGPWEKSKSAIMSISMLLCIAAVMSVSSDIPYIILHNGLLTPLIALFIYALAGDRGFVSSFLSSPKMILLGEASYALYLFHLPFARYMRRLGTMIGINVDSILYIALIGCAAVCCSIVLHRFIEEPGRIVLRSRLKKLSAASAEAARTKILVYGSGAATR